MALALDEVRKVSVENPLDWYLNKYCSKCEKRPCTAAGSGVYSPNWNAKLMCAIAASIMYQFDRTTLKQIRGKK
jgi:hypothetical protein